MKCRHCAANNIDNAVFCKHCGVVITRTKPQPDPQLAVQHAPASDPTVEQAAKRVRLDSPVTDQLLHAVAADTADRSSLRAKVKPMLTGSRFKLWSLMGGSFIIFPLLVAGLTSFVIPWVMKQFYSNDLQIQDAVKQQAVNSNSALWEQQSLQRGRLQTEHLNAAINRHYQLLLFYQDQSEQFYQLHGRFPQHLNELQQYPVMKADMPLDEKVTILDQGVIMTSSDKLPQLKLYAVPQRQADQRIKWQCYSTSEILSNFSTCILLNQKQTVK